MKQEQIERINELARKSKTTGLTPEEKEEQKKLRAEYIASVRMNLRTQLDNINIQEKDGSIVNLGEKYGKKKKKRHRNYSDVENDISADDNTIKVADGVNNIDSKANSDVEKIGHSDISENNSKINNSDSNDNDS